jgi:hypothetical protein
VPPFGQDVFFFEMQDVFFFEMNDDIRHTITAMQSISMSTCSGHAGTQAKIRAGE